MRTISVLQLHMQSKHILSLNYTNIIKFIVLIREIEHSFMAFIYCKENCNFLAIISYF